MLGHMAGIRWGVQEACAGGHKLTGAAETFYQRLSERGPSGPRARRAPRARLPTVLRRGASQRRGADARAPCPSQQVPCLLSRCGPWPAAPFGVCSSDKHGITSERRRNCEFQTINVHKCYGVWSKKSASPVLREGT